MKYFLILLMGLNVLAYKTLAAEGPYPPAVDARFKIIERMTGSSKQYDHVARVRYDVSSLGGASGSSYGLGVYLPAKAVVAGVEVYIDTAFSAAVAASAPTVALFCEDAGNIMTATNFSLSTYPAGTIFEAGFIQATTSVAAAAIGASCEIKATVASASISTGKLTAFIHYFLHD